MFISSISKFIRPAFLRNSFSFSTESKPQISRTPKQPFMKITDRAIKRINQLLQKKNDSEIIGVKVTLTKRGCNGLTYGMNYIKQKDLKKFDQLIQIDSKAKVIVDSKAVMAILGTQLDFVDSEIGSQFVFKNPNQKGRCGCGESFHL